MQYPLKSQKIRFILLLAVILIGSEKTTATTKLPCEFSEIQITQNPSIRAAMLACDEHRLWQEPFINLTGHISKIGPMEGERDKLKNGIPAWQRVLYYWQNSVGESVLFHNQEIPLYEDKKVQQAIIRSQLIDTPWSSAFISYLMKKAGFTAEQFHFNDAHIRYIKPAYTNALQQTPFQPNYAYQTQNPFNTSLTMGDLVCYAREGKRVFGAIGFEQWLNEHYNSSTSLRMHCDIIVYTQHKMAYAIGGNVAQAVTMRALKLTEQGYLSPELALPPHTPSLISSHKTPTCSIKTDTHCNMNQKDWVVLLKYRDTTPNNP